MADKAVRVGIHSEVTAEFWLNPTPKGWCEDPSFLSKADYADYLATKKKWEAWQERILKMRSASREAASEEQEKAELKRLKAKFG